MEVHALTKPLQWDQEEGAILLLDQRKLPRELDYWRCRTIGELALAIRQMAIRGAPSLALAGAFGMALAAWENRSQPITAAKKAIEDAKSVLQCSRPTAVNLRWAIDRVWRKITNASTPDELIQKALEEARAIEEEIQLVHRQLAGYGVSLVPDGAQIYHHCHTGALAGGGFGTALGIILQAFQSGKKLHVFVGETRPLLQGARLTAWELARAGIPHTVVVDSASGSLMRSGHIHLCFVGADRIAANGDTANKIGTYTLAVLARYHDIPFYVAAPTSTIDLASPGGEAIPVEERPAEEVTSLVSYRWVPEESRVANPAFDVTPADLITAIITECGVLRPPYTSSIRQALAKREN
ncbi:S-methyl-5-thioribose-1-phosphate isomerase [Candidatus Methylacidithermus pantelleriae]|nr:S-methyl-5-thioribose-1-phosphate isomerase [Candidatus Methylacidithermus pantelleriae]